MKHNVSLIMKDILFFHRNRTELSKAKRAARRIAEMHFDAILIAEQTCNVYKKAIEIHANRQTNDNDTPLENN